MLRRCLLKSGLRGGLDAQSAKELVCKTPDQHTRLHHHPSCRCQSTNLMMRMRLGSVPLQLRGPCKWTHHQRRPQPLR